MKRDDANKQAAEVEEKARLLRVEVEGQLEPAVLGLRNTALAVLASITAADPPRSVGACVLPSIDLWIKGRGVGGGARDDSEEGEEEEPESVRVVARKLTDAI